ncbi:MAG: hypothetical protein E5Y10_24505 [Mesorhizobium sp.]|nr:MAG: hypothetical protein E5Y10_24505 [Mesorhizobium sp.]
MRHWTNEEKQRVGELLRRKLTAGQIAPRFGRSRCGVISLVNRDPSLREIGFQHCNRERAS